MSSPDPATFRNSHEKIVEALPEVRPVVQRELDSMDGESLPHVFLPSVRDYVVSEFSAGKSELAERSLSFFFEWIQSEDELLRGLVEIEFRESFALSPSEVPEGLEQLISAERQERIDAIRQAHHVRREFG